LSSKKHKRRRPKGRPRASHMPSAKARVGQPPLTPQMPPGQPLATRLGKPAVAEELSRRLGPDLRRSLLSAAIVLLVLVILYLVLR